jgi:hypothetical protein
VSYGRAQSETDRMVEMRREGCTLQQIGDRFDLTRERIRQILAVEGVTGTQWRGYQVTHYRRLGNAVAIAARRIIAEAKPGDEHFPHGTANGYARGCTCDRCRAANRERVYRTRSGGRPKTRRPELDGARNDGSHRAATYMKP